MRPPAALSGAAPARDSRDSSCRGSALSSKTDGCGSRWLSSWSLKSKVSVLFVAVVLCLSTFTSPREHSGTPWHVLQTSAAAPPKKEISPRSPSAPNETAPQDPSRLLPMLRFSEEDLRHVEDGFERHQSLYPTFLHGYSKRSSLVIYRTISTAATAEPYTIQKDLLIDGFLLHQALLQGTAASPRFLLVIDLAPINSFIKASLGPSAVAKLHKQPESALLAFVNSPHWQNLRSLFFVPSRCEGVVLLNAPSIVLQLLSVFDHFLFHPNRNFGTGRGKPSSVHAIEAALANNKGGRFLLQASLDTSALCDFVEPAEIPVEYAYACVAGQQDSEEHGKAKLGEAPETLQFFQSLFDLAQRIHGNIEKAKRRNPTLFDLSLKASAAGIKTALSFGPSLLNSAEMSECNSSADGNASAAHSTGGEKDSRQSPEKSGRRAPESGKPHSTSSVARGKEEARVHAPKRSRRPKPEKRAVRTEADSKGSQPSPRPIATEPSVPPARDSDQQKPVRDLPPAAVVATPFQVAASAPGTELVWGGGADYAWGVDATGGAWGAGQPKEELFLDRGYFVDEAEALAAGDAFDDLD